MNMSRVIAVEQEILIEDIQISVSGEIDTAKAMGIRSMKRVGFAGLNVNVNIQAQWSSDLKSLFYRELIARCPILDLAMHQQQSRMARGSDQGQGLKARDATMLFERPLSLSKSSLNWEECSISACSYAESTISWSITFFFSIMASSKHSAPSHCK